MSTAEHISGAWEPNASKRGLTSVDEHVFTTQLEEGCDILEAELERVGLPVICVIGEQDAALDVCVQH